jgi:hypothetical protein
MGRRYIIQHSISSRRRVSWLVIVIPIAAAILIAAIYIVYF